MLAPRRQPLNVSRHAAIRVSRIGVQWRQYGVGQRRLREMKAEPRIPVTRDGLCLGVKEESLATLI